MDKISFDEFPSVGSKQWKQKIQFELGGLDYNETLVTQTIDGININPFYHFDAAKNDIELQQTTDFYICQKLYITKEKLSNKLALDALNRGAEAITFIASNPFDIKVLLKDIPKETPLFFELTFASKSFFEELAIEDRLIHINYDPISHLAKTGNWFKNVKSDFTLLNDNMLHAAHTFLKIDTILYQNAGATITQQVAYALAHGVEYLNYIIQNNIKVPSKFVFSFAQGSNYFFEIAKLRAFKVSFKSILNHLNLQTKIHIFAQPTLRNKSIYDYNNNMLRTTSECMSAILGGADTISNVSYDHLFHKKNEFGERISRNQLIVLKEETDILSKDFASGSYYIESLTEEIANKALAIFKDIEKGGGFMAQLHQGTIQRKIKESAQKEQSLFDQQKLQLLGTNLHPNSDDKMSNSLERSPFPNKRVVKTLIAPIVPKRLSAKYEQKRLSDETN
ncbi:methylmalonyl-CoA mutase subunit beta [Urechidicola sp. KH5]